MENSTIYTILLSIGLGYYFFYTLSFALQFNRALVYANMPKKFVHNILIWILPFFWINAIKIHPKQKTSDRNSSETDNKSVTDDTDLLWWGLPFYSFFHSSSHSTNTSETENNTISTEQEAYTYKGNDSLDTHSDTTSYDNNSDSGSYDSGGDSGGGDSGGGD